MSGYDTMGPRDQRKHATNRVTQYLVNELCRILTPSVWTSRFGSNPATVIVETLKICIFVRCAEIIVNNSRSRIHVPRHIMDYLKDAIALREQEIKFFTPLFDLDEKAREQHDKHEAFVDVLRDIRRMFEEAERRSHPQTSVSAASDIEDFAFVFGYYATLEVEDTIESQDSGNRIATHINSEEPILDTTTSSLDRGVLHLVAMLSPLVRLQSSVVHIWAVQCAKGTTHAISGLMTNFAYQLIEQYIATLEITGQISENNSTTVPDPGFLGTFHDHSTILERFFRAAPGEAITEDWSATLVLLYHPVIEHYLRSWYRKDELQYKKDMAKAMDLPECDCIDHKDSRGGEALHRFCFLYDTADCLVREFRRIGSLQRITKKRCYDRGDRLTLTTPDALWDPKISTWQAVALTLLLEIIMVFDTKRIILKRLSLETNVYARYVRCTVKAYQDGHSSMPPQFTRSLEIAEKYIFQDPTAELGKRFKCQPPAAFQLVANPVLTGTLCFAMLTELQNGVIAMEKEQPIITAAALLYLALKSIGKLAESWSDMDYFIAKQGRDSLFQGPEPTTLVEFYQCAKKVLRKGADRPFLAPTEQQEVIRAYAVDSSLENFKKLQSYVMSTCVRKPVVSRTKFAPYFPSISPLDDNFEPDELLEGFADMVEMEEENLIFDLVGFHYVCEPFVEQVERCFCPTQRPSKTHHYVPMFLEIISRNDGAESARLISTLVLFMAPSIQKMGGSCAKMESFATVGKMDKKEDASLWGMPI